MTFIPLPTSFLECTVLVALGWGATTAQVALLRPSVKQAVAQLTNRITFPAFIFQTLAAGGGLLGYSAKVTIISTIIHMLLSYGIGWFVTRGQNQRQQVLIAVLGLGYQTEGWAVAWCSVMWGVAGAQAAILLACTTAVLYPIFTFAAGSIASMGVPADLRHADGGVYTGQWRRAVKEGLGTYWYQNGAKYEGWWKNNVKHGRGVYHYATGGRFEGEFTDGARDGIGVRIWPHGRAKAAYFENNERIRDVQLEDAAHVMQAANEAAIMARHVTPTRLSPSVVAKHALLNGPIIATSLFTLAAISAVPIAETMEMALSTAASIHIPLSLVLLGASIPKSFPETRSAPQIRTIVAARLLPALAVAAGLLMCATQSNAHAVRSAATAACLLSPVSCQALQQAKAWKLSQPVAEGVATTSIVLSTVCMGLFSIQAWTKDVIPVFTVMSTTSINTFALVDHCFIQLALLSAMAYYGPRLFVRRLVKMAFTAKSIRHHPPRNMPSTAKPQPGSARAVPMQIPRHRNVQQRKQSTAVWTYKILQFRVPPRISRQAGTVQVMKKL